MANHIQTKKRIRQTVKRKLRNSSLRSWTRKTVIRVRAAVESGDAESAQSVLKVAVKNLDRMVTKDILKRQTASRTISRLTKAVNKLSA
ncbi:MAG: 30S ribosomal protein S20 [Deltaproteobacteria bacterium]|nr:30S ribosomal protein S20 [Deltaproteobacteria bacterium]